MTPTVHRNQYKRMHWLINYRVTSKLMSLEEATTEVSNQLALEWNAKAEDLAAAFLAVWNHDALRDTRARKLDQMKHAQHRAYAKFRLSRIDCHKGLE